MKKDSPKKTFTAKGEKGTIVTGIAKIDKNPALLNSHQPTIQSKNAEIKKETVLGEKLRKRNESKSWRSKQDGLQAVVGHDTGALSWLTPILCAFFRMVDVGYKKGLRIWNFPPDVDNPKKKHTVMFQYYYQIKGKYLLIDVFDDNTKDTKIKLIKAWLEALGYRYTYIMGSDTEMAAKDPEKFANLVFDTRLKELDRKAKDYPKFKVPQTYAEAGLPFGQTNLVGAIG